jgi:uncharacterized protein YecE (DUF72 family)
MSSIEVGISGWSYEGWRGTFYPESLSMKKELEFAGLEFPSIEINGTFYSLQKPTSYIKWYETTPEKFVFSVKANRYITHLKRLRNIEEPLSNFFASGPLALREKLGPLLWQFPPSMKFAPEIFESFLKLLPKSFREAKRLGQKSPLPQERKYLKVKVNYKIRHAVEIRNYSFMNPYFIDLLRKYNVAIVFADTAGKWPYIEDITADFIYVRLHGDSELYKSGYDQKALNFWARRIRYWQKGQESPDQLKISEDTPPKEERDVYVYFDNDAKVRAPVDAKALIKILH